VGYIFEIVVVLVLVVVGPVSVVDGLSGSEGGNIEAVELPVGL
jgi:hypothetical protein